MLWKYKTTPGELAASKAAALEDSAAAVGSSAVEVAVLAPTGTGKNKAQNAAASLAQAKAAPGRVAFEPNTRADAPKDAAQSHSAVEAAKPTAAEHGNSDAGDAEVDSEAEIEEQIDNEEEEEAQEEEEDYDEQSGEEVVEYGDYEQGGEGSDAEEAEEAEAYDSDYELPEGWEALVDDDGDVYYYNEETDSSQWERP